MLISPLMRFTSMLTIEMDASGLTGAQRHAVMLYGLHLWPIRAGGLSSALAEELLAQVESQARVAGPTWTRRVRDLARLVEDPAVERLTTRVLEAELDSTMYWLLAERLHALLRRFLEADGEP